VVSPPSTLNFLPLPFCENSQPTFPHFLPESSAPDSQALLGFRLASCMPLPTEPYTHHRQRPSDRAGRLDLQNYAATRADSMWARVMQRFAAQYAMSFILLASDIDTGPPGQQHLRLHCLGAHWVRQSTAASNLRRHTKSSYQDQDKRHRHHRRMGKGNLFRPSCVFEPCVADSCDFEPRVADSVQHQSSMSWTCGA
jgi:hypothetical protein